jgi:hypothetical protein
MEVAIIVALVIIAVGQHITIHYLNKANDKLWDVLNSQKRHIEAQDEYIDVRSKAKWN